MKQAIYIFFFFVPFFGNAQYAFVSTGGQAIGTEGYLSYSVGQVFYKVQEGTDGSLSPGVQQPFVIFEATSIEEAERIHLVFKAYPNPVNSVLYLDVPSFETDNLSYQVIDVKGGLLRNQVIQQAHSRIFLYDQLPGIYFLRVSKNNVVLKTFKIIKTN